MRLMQQVWERAGACQRLAEPALPQPGSTEVPLRDSTLNDGQMFATRGMFLERAPQQAAQFEHGAQQPQAAASQQESSTGNLGG